jgi:hypothetical protein
MNPNSTQNLRSRGPAIVHFHGTVDQVFGTSHRPTPSQRPLAVAAALLLVALVLPYIFALLPVIVIVLVLLWILRRWGWIRAAMRLPRFRGSRPDAGLTSTTFRVRILADDETTEFAVIDCRFVQKAEVGPAFIAPGDTITGRGRKAGGGLIDVSRLDVGVSQMITLRAVSPRSDAPVVVMAGLIVACAAVLVYLQWDIIASFDLQSVLYPLLGFLVPLVAIYVIVKKVIFRR